MSHPLSTPVRRPAAVLLVVTLVLVALAARPAAAATGQVERVLTDSVNATRQAAGLAPLRVDVRLVEAARSWSRTMADGVGLDHSGDALVLPDEVTAWAENVGWTASTVDPAAELAAEFLTSPRHLAAIRDPRFTDLGVGAVQSGRHTWVTEIFATTDPVAPTPSADPAPVPAPEPAPAPAPVDHVVGLADRAEALFAGEAARHAVIARDDAFPDALAAGPLAGPDGPLLLTPPGQRLHPEVRAALDATVPPGATVYLVGGPGAVSDDVVRELQEAGWAPRRLSGPDRVTTAAAVAWAMAERDGPPDEVLLADSEDWPDAAAGGAYGAAVGAPVLLAHPDEVPDATRAVLDQLRPARVAALGGPDVLHDDVVRATGAERVAGPTREGTAVAVAARLWGRTAAAHGDRWIAARADSWQWALGAAPAAASVDAPVLLVGAAPASAVTEYLDGLGYGHGVTGTLDVMGPVDPGAVDAVRGALD